MTSGTTSVDRSTQEHPRRSGDGCRDAANIRRRRRRFGHILTRGRELQPLDSVTALVDRPRCSRVGRDCRFLFILFDLDLRVGPI